MSDNTVSHQARRATPEHTSSGECSESEWAFDVDSHGEKGEKMDVETGEEMDGETREDQRDLLDLQHYYSRSKIYIFLQTQTM